MDRTKLKNYAPQARLDFIQAMVDQAAFYGITVDRIEPMTERGDIAVIAGRELPISIAKKRKKLEKRIRRDGFHQTMEAIAYTWFNRLVAIRYMELKGYFDHGYRVLSHPDNKPIPEILQYAEYLELPGLKKDLVVELKLDGSKESELYRLLLTAQCNALSRTIPFLFGWIDDETELLLPNELLKTDSLVRSLVENLSAEDCESVEVLGWLYQFYIAERKDQVMARKSAVPTEDIPAVTQLFTPHWIVRYLVENSLGRLWLLNRPGSQLREHMPYYIEGQPEPEFLKITKPEDIRLCDPAVGSGHMLTYAFDLLTLIYEEEGYAPTEIPGLILRHNLHGLEICPRAAQLAELALVFKAREKSRRFFQPEHLVRPSIIELREVRFAEGELGDYIRDLNLDNLFNQSVLKLFNQFEEAKNVGSLIQPCLDECAIADVRRAIEAKDLGDQIFLRETHVKVLRVLEQAEALTQRYHVVVANPPYMGGKQMNLFLKEFAKLSYPTAKADLFSMFIERGLSLAVARGTSAMITMQSWMFLSSFEEMRVTLCSQKTLVSMVHLGAQAFDSIGGAVVQSTAFVLRNAPPRGEPSTFVRLVDGRSEAEKSEQFVEALMQNRVDAIFRLSTEAFLNIPGRPIAYWLSPRAIAAYQRGRLGKVCHGQPGLQTSNNARFVRQWTEVSVSDIGFGYATSPDAKASGKRWFPYLKGGDFRKWYGNQSEVVNWGADGAEIKAYVTEKYPYLNGNIDYVVKDRGYYFQRLISYTKITSGTFSARTADAGFLFDVAGSSVFPSDSDHGLILGFLCSPLADMYLGAQNPTVNIQSGDVANLPFEPTIIESHGGAVREIVTALTKLARTDWDNFETSWDFRDQPLLRPGLKGATLEASWRNWEAQSTAAIRRMHELETENNRLFIAAYGLDGELQPEVPEEQITLARAEARRDMAAFLSYAVGCIMGRYSPDHPGLILANAGDSLHEFLAKEGKPLSELTFAPDEDGIIPVLDSEWFEDDIVARTRDFLRVTFGDATLSENLKFIEQSLGKDGKPKSLREYYTGDFYKDHLQTYKRRPIYWLFSSGKQRAFQCLVYLHRYNEGTLARMRTEYVIPLQGQIAARIDQLEGDKAKATSTSHRTKIQKEQDKLKKQQGEIAAFEEKLKHYADMRISLDLDDGVKVNYAKFGDLLAESKAITGGKDDE
jgi:hypothetical protein